MYRAAAACALLLTGALLAPPAVAADAPLVLPRRFGTQPVDLQQVAGSAQALVYLRLEGPGRSGELGRLLTAAGPVQLQVPAYQQLSLVGTQVAYESPVVPDATPTRATMVDLATGLRTFGDVRYDFGTGATSDTTSNFVTGTGNGWLDVVAGVDPATGLFARTLVRHTVGQPDRLLRALPPHTFVRRATADSRGALVLLESFTPGEPAVLQLLDTTAASGPPQVTQLWSGTLNQLFWALSPQRFAWSTDNSQVHVVPRSTPASSGSTRAVPAYSLAGLALTDTALAWVQSRRIDQQGTEAYSTFSAADGAAPRAVQTDQAADTRSVAAVGDSFAVVAGGTSRTRGVYRLGAGDVTVGALLQAAGPAAPAAVRASAGRLLFRENGFSVSGSSTLVEQGLTASGTAVARRGAERSLGTTRQVFDSQGGRSATLEYTRTGQELVVRSGTTVVLRRALSYGVDDVAVSGHRVAVSSSGEPAPDGTVGPPTTRLYDLRTPTAAPRVLAGVQSAALAGRRLAWLTETGAVVSLDLDTPGAQAVQVRPAGFPGDVAVPQSQMVLEAAGDWVAWSFAEPGSYPARAAETAAARVSSPTTRRTLTIDPAELHLADGLLGWVDRDDAEAHVLQLGPGTDRVLGRTLPGVYEAQLALSDDLAAYVAVDGSTRVFPAPTPDRAPTLLGGTVSPRLTGTVPFRLALDVTQPLTACTLEFSSAGRVVSAITGAAPDGGIRASWSGTGTSGAVLPDGTYTWRLSGTARDGRVLRADGPAAALTGQVVLDRTA